LKAPSADGIGILSVRFVKIEPIPSPIFITKTLKKFVIALFFFRK
jgi:hypothetical protein